MSRSTPLVNRTQLGLALPLTLLVLTAVSLLVLGAVQIALWQQQMVYSNGVVANSFALAEQAIDEVLQAQSQPSANGQQRPLLRAQQMGASQVALHCDHGTGLQWPVTVPDAAHWQAWAQIAFRGASPALDGDSVALPYQRFEIVGCGGRRGGAFITENRRALRLRVK